MNYDLGSSLDKKLVELEYSVKRLRETGEDKAQAEQRYKIALAKEALKLRDDKLPATLINLVVYGSGEVPNLRLQRDIKETIYQANQDAINSLKLQIRVIENQIEREWNQANRT